jgi:hypothetical protein
MCYESGMHPIESPDIIQAPSRGIHPAIKIKLGEMMKDNNIKPSQMLFRLENSDFLKTHQLPTLQQIRQYKADIAKEVGWNIDTLSSFCEFLKDYKVRNRYLHSM